MPGKGNRKEKRTKPRYEPPVVVPLGELAKGTGVCNVGSANTQGACNYGGAAGGGCGAGAAGATA